MSSLYDFQIVVRRLAGHFSQCPASLFQYQPAVPIEEEKRDCCHGELNSRPPDSSHNLCDFLYHGSNWRVAHLADTTDCGNFDRGDSGLEMAAGFDGMADAPRGKRHHIIMAIA